MNTDKRKKLNFKIIASSLQGVVSVTESFIQKTESVCNSFDEFKQSVNIIEKKPSKFISKSKNNYKK